MFEKFCNQQVVLNPQFLQGISVCIFFFFLLYLFSSGISPDLEKQLWSRKSPILKATFLVFAHSYLTYPQNYIGIGQIYTAKNLQTERKQGWGEVIMNFATDNYTFLC